MIPACELTPRRVRRARQRAVARLVALAVAGVGLAVVTGVSAGLWVHAERAEQRVDEADAQRRAALVEMERYGDLRALVEERDELAPAAQAAWEGHVAWADELAALVDRLPDGAQVVSVVVDRADPQPVWEVDGAPVASVALTVRVDGLEVQPDAVAALQSVADRDGWERVLVDEVVTQSEDVQVQVRALVTDARLSGFAADGLGDRDEVVAGPGGDR